MSKNRLIVLLLFLPSVSFGQEIDIPQNVIYIVDSIPIIEEPEEGMNTLDASVIHEIVVVKNKEELERLGYGKMDGAIFIFTKEYANRSDEIKAIPTTKKMTRKNGIWHLNGVDTPYSGKFIDYYVTGKKEGEGTLKNGLVDGLRTKYYPNGTISLERNYKDGVEHGWEKEYYRDGTLKQTGEFNNLKEVGKWEMYFPNGQVKQSSTFKNGVMIGETILYYSTGKVKIKQAFKDGKPISNKDRKKLISQYNQGLENDRIGNFKSSIKFYTKCINLDSTFVEAYFARGTANLNNYQFDDAIIDFNQALTIEPLYMEAYGNRAFSKIRQYQIGNSRVLSQNSGVTVLASKDNVEIPVDELRKVCEDLNMAVSLGDKSMTVKQGLEEFCKQKADNNR